MAFNFNRSVLAVFTALASACTTVPQSPSANSDQELKDAANTFLNAVTKEKDNGCRYIPDSKNPDESAAKCLPKREFPN